MGAKGIVAEIWPKGWCTRIVAAPAVVCPPNPMLHHAHSTPMLPHPYTQNRSAAAAALDAADGVMDGKYYGRPIVERPAQRVMHQYFHSAHLPPPFICSVVLQSMLPDHSSRVHIDALGRTSFWVALVWKDKEALLPFISTHARALQGGASAGVHVT